jgi:hypothetical protein
VVHTAKGKGILKKISVFEESAVIQLENGTEDKITLEELKTFLEKNKGHKDREQKTT